MDSNQGFDPASDAWRGRDFVGKTRVQEPKSSPERLRLCDEDQSAGPQSLGGMAAVL